MVRVDKVIPGGIAASLGLEPGDRIVAAGGEAVRDFLDVLLAEKLPDVDLVVEKPDGELWQVEIEKEADEPFGFVLEHPDPKRCGNNCLFCFVHQLPQGLRRTLYVKDEDYRFSYLYGAYVTLSNLDEGDVDRIVRQRLSPLYVSVHAVDEGLRSRLLGRQTPPLMPMLKRLLEAGIELHAQIVVCPGLNDGVALDESVEQLAGLYPGLRTLALVPVGLTRHRNGLEPLRPLQKDDAVSLLRKLDTWQSDCLDRFGSRFVFAADEVYLKAGRDLPALSEYEDLAQLENGVGMIALFRDEAAEALAEVEVLEDPVEFSIVTGTAFRRELQRFLNELDDRTGCRAHVYAIENQLFGPSVSVAGLISGRDILAGLEGRILGSALLVPDVMMRDGDHLFLDDLSPSEVAAALGVRVRVVPSTPWGIVEAVEELAESSSNGGR